MSGWRPAGARVAVAIAVASLGTAAQGSNSATSRGSTDLANALVVAQDGKLVAAGLSTRRGRAFALARYTPDGELDRSFGTGGKVLTPFGAPSYAGANSVAVTPNGKITAGGYGYVHSKISSDFVLARYTAAGRLDRTFGEGGKVVTRSGQGVRALALQRDGKLVAVGATYNWRFAVVRYTRAGALDRSFGRGGTAVTDFGARSRSSAEAVAIQPNGRIVVAGYTFRGTKTNFAVARYKANGTLDRRFGSGGRVVTEIGEGFSEASAIVIQPDGKLVVAGDAGLVRYDAHGELDSAFGLEGVAVPKAGGPSALAIQRDHKLVTAGTHRGGRHGYNAFALARFLEDGSPDESFGRGGWLRTEIQTQASANAVVARPDGKLVAAGTTGGQNFALVGYTSRGQLDSSFGSRGKVVTDFGSAWATLGR
jgi:uncharacterized delta-60 repeat protein